MSMLDHIAINYLYYENDVANSLLMEASNISDESAQYISQKYGRFLFYEIKENNVDMQSELIDRLMAYWESRKNSNTSDRELTSFELWFMSDQFDKTWAINNLLFVLKKVKSIQSTHGIISSISGYVDVLPKEVIQCIRELLAKEEHNFFIYDYDETVNKMMYRLLGQEDEIIRNEAKSIIHEFGSKGNTSLRDLLTKNE
jgi:hypothetical protein